MPISNSSSKQSQEHQSSSQVNSFAQNSIDENSRILLSENPNRKGLTLYNDLSSEVLIDVGANYFTSGSYMFALPVKEFYEMSSPVFTGIIAAKSLPGTTGVLLVREFE